MTHARARLLNPCRIRPRPRPMNPSSTRKTLYFAARPVGQIAVRRPPIGRFGRTTQTAHVLAHVKSIRIVVDQLYAGISPTKALTSQLGRQSAVSEDLLRYVARTHSSAQCHP